MNSNQKKLLRDLAARLSRLRLTTGSGMPKTNRHIFDMNRILETDSYGCSKNELIKNIKKHKCGSAGCAIGQFLLDHPRSYLWKSFDCIEGGIEGEFCESVARHFGLTISDVYYLFVKSSYDSITVTPKMVAKRILEVLEKY